MMVLWLLPMNLLSLSKSQFCLVMVLSRLLPMNLLLLSKSQFSLMMVLWPLLSRIEPSSSDPVSILFDPSVFHAFPHYSKLLVENQLSESVGIEAINSFTC